MEKEYCHKSQASEEAKHEDSNENQQDQLNIIPYGLNISNDVWSCIVGIVVYWLIG